MYVYAYLGNQAGYRNTIYYQPEVRRGEYRGLEVLVCILFP